jgi:hypothetical protein
MLAVRKVRGGDPWRTVVSPKCLHTIGRATTGRKLVVVAALAMTLALVARPSVASSTVMTTGTTIPGTPTTTVSATSPCESGPVRISATHVPASGLVEVDPDTHRRFDPIRVLPLDNPLATTIAGGFVYVSYMPPGPKAGFRVARINPETGGVVRSAWFPGDSYNQPPVVAYGSVWVVTGLCGFQVVRMNQVTLAVTMTTPLPQDLNNSYLSPVDGALWLASSVSASLARLDPRTGHISTVLVPEMAPNSQVVGITSGSSSGYLYVSVINQNAAHSQVIERFDPATGSFFVVPAPPFELTRVLGVAGDILWVIQGGGMVTHFAPFSTSSLVLLSCTRAVTCALAGFNGAVDGSVEDGIFAFEHIGGTEGRPGSLLLDCIGGPRVSTVARLQLPSDFPIPGGSSLPSILLALGDGYLVTLARVGIDGGSGLAVFPLDPRCTP